MKLYTEEQVRRAIQMADKYHYLLDDEEDSIISLLTPIELPSDGLTKREHFALKCFQSILSNPQLEHSLDKKNVDWVVFAVKCGDALIKELNK